MLETSASEKQLKGGFQANRFEHLASVEQGNFWFRARNSIILWFIERYAPDFCSFMEVGCGTGFVLQGIAQRFGDREYTGTEYLTEGLAIAAKRVPFATFMQMDARHIPFSQKFDLIGSFDVIEHINEDAQVLEEMSKALKPGGFVLITVPQHQWLWSDRDVYAHHVRRYGKEDLHKKLEAAGFRVIRSTSFVCLLLPLLIASRFLDRLRPKKQLEKNRELKPPGLLNKVMEYVILLELCLMKIGVDLPIGGSRIVIARKEGLWEV